MKCLIIGSLALGVSLLSASTATAQRRVPHAGSGGIGVEAGVFVPSDDAFGSSPALDVFIEHYATPRVSIRGDVGWTDPGHTWEPSDSLRQVPVRVGLDYNWEGGRWHPFVGAGLGLYFLQFKDNGRAFGESQTKAGVNVGGGLEYFLTRTFAFKGEMRYHAIGRANGGDPSGLGVTAGLKSYF